MKKEIDIQLLVRVLLHAQKYFQLNRNSLNKPAEIVCALVDETLVQIRNEYPIQDVIFDYAEIHQLVWGNSENTESAAKKVRGHRAKIFDLLAHDSDLSKYLIEQCENNHLTFEIDESTGGAGAKTTMWLGLSDNTADDKYTKSDFAVYRATQLKKPYFWIKPFANTVLKGWSIWGFIFIPLCALMGIPYLIFSLTKTQSAFYIITAIIGIYILWRLLFIIYELMEKGVAKVPDLMVRIHEQNALFTVSREHSTDREKRGYKVIELVVYEANCPVCGDILYIENGGKRFNGRYVGKCTLAPSEHLFTFDHVTKRGVPARNT